ncbi:unnamed protein product [Linum trigynum]|uniref:Uncharacterized protein n=1 Tax=Linum trigynum TaxID=586398 RepID=A0AAV2E0F6_9ROSI
MWPFSSLTTTKALNRVRCPHESTSGRGYLLYLVLQNVRNDEGVDDLVFFLLCFSSLPFYAHQPKWKEMRQFCSSMIGDTIPLFSIHQW